MSDPVLFRRADWGAAPPTRDPARASYPEPTVFIHHEGGQPIDPSGTWRFDDEAAHMRRLQSDMQRRGYVDIAYSVVVFPSGRAYEGRDLSREEAATKGRAGDSISIMFAGNYEQQPPTEAALDSAAWVIDIARYFGIVVPAVEILGHRDQVGTTVCPGRLLYDALPDLRARVHAPDTPATRWHEEWEATDMPKPTDCVGILSTEHGAWKLYADGGIHTLRGQFWGSYPGLPPAGRQGDRYFVSITRRIDLPDKPGYTIVAHDGATYTFGEGVQ